jgi:hypothetical protein
MTWEERLNAALAAGDPNAGFGTAVQNTPARHGASKVGHPIHHWATPRGRRPLTRSLLRGQPGVLCVYRGRGALRFAGLCARLLVSVRAHQVHALPERLRLASILSPQVENKKKRAAELHAEEQIDMSPLGAKASRKAYK